MKKIIFSAVVIAFFISQDFYCFSAQSQTNVKAQLKKYASIKIRVTESLNSNQQKFLEELVAAARYMDEIFLRQVYNKNIELRDSISNKNLKEYFEINFGPFDRLNHDAPFMADIPSKPLGSNFYPEDLTKEEFNLWLQTHPEDKTNFESNFTVIKRSDAGLKSIPYSQEYKDLLLPAAEHLKNAAELTDNPSLKKYLLSRAEAFLSNDYFQSDVDWMRLEGHDFEIVFGPYEVYEDGLFGYKAAFEAFITLVDKSESEKLKTILQHLNDFTKNLPVDEQYKGEGRNPNSPLFVANEIYTAGDTKCGIQTIAFNLPNDERVRKQEGSKKVMLKNIQHAKFEKILKPIAKQTLSKADAANIDFDAFFAHTLLHEISHGVGPGEITKNGIKTTVGKELKEFYSVIEETKADTLGIYNNTYLANKNFYTKDFNKKLFATYLAGIFRSIRFGINEAHGGANAIQLNYLTEKEGINYNEKNKTYSIDYNKIDGAIKDLAHDLLMIEAKGDYNAAKIFIEKYGSLREETKTTLSKLNSVPVDIKPIYDYK